MYLESTFKFLPKKKKISNVDIESESYHLIPLSKSFLIS